MKGHLLMSAKERRRKTVFEGVVDGRFNLVEASQCLGLSYRQTLRSYKRFVENGDEGLVHRSRGRPSNRGKPGRLKRTVIRRYKERYEELDMGPTQSGVKDENIARAVSQKHISVNWCRWMAVITNGLGLSVLMRAS